MTRKQLWGGRFTKTPAGALKTFNDSFSFDIQLLELDVIGSIAWAQALGRAGVLTVDETDAIVDALGQIGSVEPAADDVDHEDVHSYVEAKLEEKLGPLAGKLHTGRSRNDQVATDFRMFVRDALVAAKERTLDLGDVLAEHGKAEAHSPLPGYTHLQQAEVITFGHWALAYVEMLLRDVDRFQSAIDRSDECPLGSGALAGTPVSLDRHRLAESLGFSRPTANSLDAVCDRDFAADYLYSTAMLFNHLSKLAEDLITFSSQEFGFVELSDAWSTGSSRMPQKKNPDVLELVRGHAGRMIGELTGLLSLLKGLPLAYNKDLQLDKEPVFRSRILVDSALPALSGLLSSLSLQRERMRGAASNDSLLATQLTDAIVRRGIPFRRAHEIVSRRLAEAIAEGTTLRELGPSSEITPRDLESLDAELAVEGKSSVGGTAPSRVKVAAVAAKERIASLRADSSTAAFDRSATGVAMKDS